MSEGIKEIVWGYLDNALEEGHFEKDGYLYGASDQDIAVDLTFFAADCESFAPDTLVPHVESWRERNERDEGIQQ